MRALLSLALVFVAFLGFSPGLMAQEEANWEVVSRIRDEGLRRSQVMDIVGYMADVLGPRLTA